VHALVSLILFWVSRLDALMANPELYPPDGNATSIKDDLGELKVSVQDNGLLSDLTDRNGNFFSFGFTPEGWLSTDTSPLSTTPQRLSREVLEGGQPCDAHHAVESCHHL